MPWSSTQRDASPTPSPVPSTGAGTKTKLRPATTPGRPSASPKRSPAGVLDQQSVTKIRYPTGLVGPRRGRRYRMSPEQPAVAAWDVCPLTGLRRSPKTSAPWPRRPSLGNVLIVIAARPHGTHLVYQEPMSFPWRTGLSCPRNAQMARLTACRHQRSWPFWPAGNGRGGSLATGYGLAGTSTAGLDGGLEQIGGGAAEDVAQRGENSEVEPFRRFGRRAGRPAPVKGRCRARPGAGGRRWSGAWRWRP